MQLFGSTRSRVGRDHALICPDSFVQAALPGWTKTQGIILIAPPMGARFTQYLAIMEAGARAGVATAGIERFVFVLNGSIKVQVSGKPAADLGPGGYFFKPAGIDASLEATSASRLNIFEKSYIPLAGAGKPEPVIGREQEVQGAAFMGDPDAMLQTLLPDQPAYDMAVNVFRFKPGAALPLVEIHVMEHGLLMLAGSGIYRLGDSWYPVQAGDVIWMKSFCPQWFVAMGKERAGYLYYKDVQRDPMDIR